MQEHFFASWSCWLPVLVITTCIHLCDAWPDIICRYLGTHRWWGSKNILFGQGIVTLIENVIILTKFWSLVSPEGNIFRYRQWSKFHKNDDIFVLIECSPDSADHYVRRHQTRNTRMQCILCQHFMRICIIIHSSLIDTLDVELPKVSHWQQTVVMMPTLSLLPLKQPQVTLITIKLASWRRSVFMTYHKVQ